VTHLTNEQLEEVLLTGEDSSNHLASCMECQKRLAEKKAIQNRLKLAFDRLSIPASLSGRIKSQLPTKSRSQNRILFPWPRSPWMVGSLVAAVLALGFFLTFHFGVIPLESVAQAQLVQVHQANLTPDSHMVMSSDVEKLTAHLQSQLGYAPQAPRPVRNTTLAGCCVRRYCIQKVGCYILKTPEGVVSIVVIENHPKSLGMSKQKHCARCIECTCWKKSLGTVNAAAVQRGPYSYYAVGNLSQEKLTGILMAAYPSDSQ